MPVFSIYLSLIPFLSHVCFTKRPLNHVAYELNNYTNLGFKGKNVNHILYITAARRGLFAPAYTMVLILDGNSEMVAHVWSKIGNHICVKVIV